MGLSLGYWFRWLLKDSFRLRETQVKSTEKHRKDQARKLEKEKSMKSKREFNGIQWLRVDQKNAWQHIQIDPNGREYVAFMSYNTPIMLVTHWCEEEQHYVNVAINENAYGYSRTTSKQLSQFISYLHLFTSWGYAIPYSFKQIIEECRTESIEKFDEYYIEDLMVLPCTAQQLKDMLYVMKYTTEKNNSLELRDVR